MGVLTLQQAKDKFGEDNIRKIFEIQIHENMYPVYSIEGYEHNLGKYNGCPDTWWLDYSQYDTEIGNPERELIPYIDKGVHRVCWEVNYRQFNSSKYKWDEWSIRSGGVCTIKANGKEVYKFHYRDLNGAMAAAQVKIDKMIEHPFNFINPETEIGRKIWYHNLPAKILLGYEPGEIKIEPDLEYMSSKQWWGELERRTTKLTSKEVSEEEIEDMEIEQQYFNESKDYGSINHGSVFYDGMINWFRN